ncbi:hypothetical protein FNH13_01715 [Ornithinimicrobium ciconiae]|uniref:DUF2613 family protein n=1 Tax=Ornithinimicrobium ciconiae TaxID=2594265 RepID=A0A516G6P1_9MICO|nr:hypothetical protein [Ornithinimicrobium ciconiae]QDO87197.1 hypothetical protein FNH13_01715 [Ornithinimicrobium ciconiae]
MSQSTSAARVVPVVLALVVGLGAAGAATAAVVNSFSPDDGTAKDSGPVEPVPAGELLGYGE